MAIVFADRVKEQTSGVGVGPVILTGAVAGFRTFSAAVGDTNETYYTIAHDTDNSWEVGIGTVSPGSLSRDTVLSSSNGGAPVNFLAGTKTVFATAPATFFSNALDVAAHALINHTGLPGIVPESFTSADHDSVDHRAAPFNLLDGAAHETIDHTLAPLSLLNTAAHAAIDHLAAPFNLLDEPTHDLLDHTGLPGVPTLVPTTIITFGNNSFAAPNDPLFPWGASVGTGTEIAMPFGGRITTFATDTLTSAGTVDIFINGLLAASIPVGPLATGTVVGTPAVVAGDQIEMFDQTIGVAGRCNISLTIEP